MVRGCPRKTSAVRTMDEERVNFRDFVRTFRSSFIGQGTTTRRQRRDLFSLRVKLPPVTISLITQKVIPLSALPKDTTSELDGISPHYLFFMLNVRQGSCECQLLNVYGRLLSAGTGMREIWSFNPGRC